MVTPLLDRDTVNIEGTERLIERLIEGGVAGLFILGTTGEAPCLGFRLRSEFIALVCRRVARRVPVLVGITDPAFVESVRIANVAADCGADAVVLSMPYYFPAGQTELLRYVKHIVPRLPLPVMLYNMPSLTRVWFKIESIRQLMDNEKIIGVKDSGGDLDYFEALLSLKEFREDWSVLIGPEHLMPKSVMMGGDGGVNGGANLFPKLFVDAFHASKSGDKNRVSELQSQIDQLQGIYEIGKYASKIVKAVKCGLSILDVCDDVMAEPFNSFMPPERQRVQEILSGFTP